MDNELSGYDYNRPLMKRIRKIVTDWEAEYGEGSVKMMKADYLSHRSVQDNYKMESAQNYLVIISAYFFMFIYISLTLGLFPSIVHMKFGLGAVGIGITCGSLAASIGINFYWND